MTVHQIAAHHTVVLEGCDGTGKTTLADTLATHHGFTVRHSGRTPDHLDLVTHYQRLLATPGRLVLDRCFLSERVYGPLYRHRSRLTWPDTLGLVAKVVARDGIFVHLTGPTAVILGRLAGRDGATTATTSQIEELRAAYERLFTRLAAHAPILRIDITSQPGKAT